MSDENWLQDCPACFVPILRDCQDGTCPVTLALLNLAMVAESESAFRSLFCRLSQIDAGGGDADRLAELVALQYLYPEAYTLVADTKAAIETGWQYRASAKERVVALARAFDRCVVRSPLGSIALYSFGDQRCLDAVTAELVEQFRAWDLLGRQRRVLDIGCGIGRLEEALAAEVSGITGIDISPAMIEVACRRCAGLANVNVARVNGMDLLTFGSQSFDTVIALDSFPYLVDCGSEVVTTQFMEVSRVLAPGGRFAILNFSYRGDADADLADVRRLGAQAQLRLVRHGVAAPRMWAGTAFVLSKAERSDRD